MNLPLTHPLRLAYHIGYCLDFLIVSACYGAIYRLIYKPHQTRTKKLHFHRFIKYQDDNVSGLTEAARKMRRTKNLVSMKFNLLNFLMETLSVLLLLAIKSYFIRILYLLVRYIYILYLLSTHIYMSLLVSYCGTPLVYYLGMEENRKAAQAYIRSTIQVVRRPAKVAPSPAPSPLPSAGVFIVSDVDVDKRNIKTAQSANTIPGQVEEQTS